MKHVVIFYGECNLLLLLFLMLLLRRVRLSSNRLPECSLVRRLPTNYGLQSHKMLPITLTQVNQEAAYFHRRTNDVYAPV